jgi:hypothetical protein
VSATTLTYQDLYVLLAAVTLLGALPALLLSSRAAHERG